MSCTNRRIQLTESVSTLVCDCDECFCSQGCDNCTDEECLEAKRRRRTEWLGLLLPTEAAPCYWLTCPSRAKQAIVAGFDNQPKVVDVCEVHASKLMPVTRA